VEHPAAERHGPLPLVCYAFGADVAGYPRPRGPTTQVPSPGAIPEPRPAGGTEVLILRPVGLFGVNADSRCARVFQSIAACR
jgi:hypothetical protein